MIDRPVTGEPVTSKSIVTVNVLPGQIVPVIVLSAVRVAADAGLTIARTENITNSANMPVNIFFIIYSSINKVK